MTDVLERIVAAGFTVCLSFGDERAPQGQWRAVAKHEAFGSIESFGPRIGQVLENLERKVLTKAHELDAQMRVTTAPLAKALNDLRGAFD